MTYSLRAVFNVILLVGLGLSVLTQWGGGDAQAAANPDLATDVQQFASRCEQALTTHNHDFSAKVSVGDGCACLARELAETHNADLVSAETLLVSLVESPVDSQMTEPDWADIAAKAGLSDIALGHLLQASHAALGMCGRA